MHHLPFCCTWQSLPMTATRSIYVGNTGYPRLRASLPHSLQILGSSCCLASQLHLSLTLQPAFLSSRSLHTTPPLAKTKAEQSSRLHLYFCAGHLIFQGSPLTLQCPPGAFSGAPGWAKGARWTFCPVALDTVTVKQTIWISLFPAN